METLQWTNIKQKEVNQDVVVLTDVDENKSKSHKPKTSRVHLFVCENLRLRQTFVHLIR